MKSLTISDIRLIRKDFPILSKKVNDNPLVYLDNAATTQKPKMVIDAISDFYKQHNANVHRGVHTLSIEASEIYDNAHAKIAEFINADTDEIIFTKGTTESINIVANSIKAISGSRRQIVLSEMEHHSNIVPWQIAAKKYGFTIKYIKVDEKTLSLDYKDAKEKINSDVAIVSIAHISNSFGTLNDISKIISFARKAGSLVMIDAAQSAAHGSLDVKGLDVDFLAFSSHKMLGPTGLGVLYGKKTLLNSLGPLIYGGDMISSVSLESSEWNAVPMKFEGGTPNFADAAGFVAAVDYLNKIGMKSIAQWESKLYDYAIKELKKLKCVTIYAPSSPTAIISFNIKGVHPHDSASLLNDFGVAVRAGHHCAMPIMEKLSLPGTLRASFSFYNTFEEIDALIEGIKSVEKVFKLG